MRFLTRSLIGLFLMAATLGLFAFAGATVFEAVQTRMSEEPQSRPARERVFAANVVEVEPRTITPELETFGEVQSRRTLELRASASGAVIWLDERFESGGAVEEGDLLLRIDPRDAQSALDTAEADLAEAEADLAEAERAVELARDELAASEDQAALRERALARQRDLAERGVGTAAAVETAELAASQAGGAVLAARQAVAAAEARVDQTSNALTRAGIARDETARRLTETRITADFAGRLSGVDVVEGGLVSVNERLADLVDADALEVAFRVSTPQYARLLSDAGALISAPVRVTLDTFGANITTS